ncbi:MAG: hypothetical protein ACK56W_05615 [Pirellula sp.]
MIVESTASDISNCSVAVNDLVAPQPIKDATEQAHAARANEYRMLESNKFLRESIVGRWVGAMGGQYLTRYLAQRQFGKLRGVAKLELLRIQPNEYFLFDYND